MVIRFLRMRPRPRSSTVETAMRRIMLPVYRLRKHSQETATRTAAVASSRYIKQHRPTARHRLSPSDQLLVQSSAAMGSITAQSTVHIPAIFRTRASIMELARPLGERRNLTKGLFSYMGVVVRLGPGSFQN